MSANRDERKTMKIKTTKTNDPKKKIKSSLKLTSVEFNKKKKTSLDSLQLATRNNKLLRLLLKCSQNQLQMKMFLFRRDARKYSTKKHTQIAMT